jgi:hypothetical protein
MMSSIVTKCPTAFAADFRSAENQGDMMGAQLSAITSNERNSNASIS